MSGSFLHKNADFVFAYVHAEHFDIFALNQYALYISHVELFCHFTA